MSFPLRQASRASSLRALATADAEDVGLLKRAAAGDEAALAALYARHAAALLGYLRQLAREPSEAEELLQDTFVAAWKSAKRFESRSTVRTWLFAIARRRWRDGQRRHAPEVDADADLAQLPDPSPSPDENAFKGAELDKLSALVAQLNPAHREVLTLAFSDELSYAEIAQVLDVPVGTVKSRLNHARQALRIMWQRAAEGQ